MKRVLIGLLVGGEFQLKCDGKVVVAARQSLLRGEGLAYIDGEFKISSPDIITPDAEIKAGDSTFDFPVGGLSVSALGEERDASAEAGPPFETDAGQEPRFDVAPSL